MYCTVHTVSARCAAGPSPIQERIFYPRRSLPIQEIDLLGRHRISRALPLSLSRYPLLGAKEEAAAHAVSILMKRASFSSLPA